MDLKRKQTNKQIGNLDKRRKSSIYNQGQIVKNGTLYIKAAFVGVRLINRG